MAAHPFGPPRRPQAPKQRHAELRAEWAAFWERHHAAPWAPEDAEAGERRALEVRGSAGHKLERHQEGPAGRRYQKARTARWERRHAKRMLDRAPVKRMFRY